MNLVTLIGITASIFTATASIPQLVKVLQNKKANDLSRLMLTTLIIGLGLWVSYGALKNDWIIAIANAIPLIVNASLLLLTFYYKNSDQIE